MQISINYTINMSKELQPSDFKNELEYVEAVLGINIPKNNYTLTKQGKLTSLNLFSNGISEIDFLGNLTSLEILDLSQNKIVDFSTLSNLTSLIFFNLSNNQLSDISALSKLTSLTSLYLSENQLSDISALSNLTSLTELYLSTNQLSDISALSNLTSLTSLYLSNNQLSDISALSNLTSLTYLVLSYNQLSDISAFSNLTSLTYLVLSYNQLSDISALSKLTSLELIQIDNNPCTENENLKSRENHIDFLKLWKEKNKLQDKVAVLLPKKVVFLGNHASGKSSLLYFLQEGEYAPETSTTHVLNVAQHTLEPAESTYIKSLFENKKKTKDKKEIKEVLPIMYYDFGGQDFYHGLYQSFSSKTAFQIVVYCAEQKMIELVKDSKDRDTYKYPLSFWLKEKEYLERGTKNPYFIVENKIDGKKESAFVKDFPNVCDFDPPNGMFHVFLKALEVENITKDKYNRLQLEFLKKQLLQELYESKEESQKVIDFYKQVYKESIQTTLKIQDRSIYKIEGISPENMLTQLQLLENSGVLFLSEDKTKVIANPKAFIEHIHTEILKQDIILEKQGKLSFEEWKAIKKGTHAQLIESFMLKQKTMFIDNDAESYVFPNYLPLYSQDEEHYFLTVSVEHLAFSIEFEYFIPFGFINVLIHHFGKEPNKKKFWRDAIYFIQHEDEKPKANVFIQLNVEKLRLEVSVETRDANFDVQKYKRYVWLSLSRMYHQQKLTSWMDFKTKKGDSISKTDSDKQLIEKEFFTQNEFPETAKVSVDGNYYVSLSTLKARIEKNEYNINVTNEEGRSKLLPLYKFQVFTDKHIKKMKKIFISYSNEDIHYKKVLEKFLKPMAKFQLAKSWSCEEITPGLWDDQIQEELESSDIVIFMMSMNFASSDYILKEEVYKTFQQMKTNKDKKIVCVLVKQFPWSYFSSLKDILNINDTIINSDYEEGAIALAKLSAYQFIPYYTDTSSQNKDEHKRALKPLNQWKFEEEAYTQIIETLGKIV